MLSYQHAYHAGNFADVHKHALLMALLRVMCAQNGRLHYFDSHAGDGRYDLSGAAAQKTREAQTGIHQNRKGAVPPVLQELMAVQSEKFYLGSPLLSARMLRPHDRLTLCERHPAALQALRGACRGDQRIEIIAKDGVETVGTYALPADWDALVLIDPSYEQKHEMMAVLKLAGTIIRRWRRARVLLWFPLLADGRHQAMLDGLNQLKIGKVDVSIIHRPPTEKDQLRMTGTAMAHIARSNWPEMAAHGAAIGDWLGLHHTTK